MNEKIKMTDTEVAEVKMIQEKFQQKIFTFGQLSIEKFEVENQIKKLNEQEIKLRDDWKNLQRMESEIIDKFLKKYGEGSLSLEDGTFIVDKK